MFEKPNIGRRASSRSCEPNINEEIVEMAFICVLPSKLVSFSEDR